MPKFSEDVLQQAVATAQSQKKPNISAIAKDRIDAQDISEIIHYFDLLKRQIELYNIEPCNIYNMDETCFQLRQGLNQSVVTVYKHKRSPTARGENITGVECIAADGWVMTPLYILTDKHQVARWYERAADEWWFGVSDTGWITDELAYTWLSSFHAQTRHRVSISKGEKRLLLMDNHGSHLTLQFLEFL